MSVLTPGCNCASHGLVEEHRHGSMCPYGVARRSEASGPAKEAMYCLDEARDALRRGNAYAAQEAMMKGAEWAQIIIDREGCKRSGTLS